MGREELNSAKPSAVRSGSSGARFTEIDVLKCVSILTVILIHSVRAPWDSTISSTEQWLGIVTRFAVPGFLFCSGFLYATTSRVPLGSVLRRLRRVLIPYLIASVGAQLWWLTHGVGRELGAALEEIALAGSFGPYYYVFLHFGLVLFSPLFALLPGAAVAGLTALLLVTQAFFESGTQLLMPFFWHVRNPLLWWGYFLLGWWIRLHYGPIRGWITQRRVPLMVGLAVAIVVFTGYATSGIGAPQTVSVRAATWIDIHAILAFVFVATCGRRVAPRPVRTIADATYAIYLFHLFFIYAVEDFMRPAENQLDLVFVATTWSAGLIGSLALIRLARTLLGERSRDIVGA